MLFDLLVKLALSSGKVDDLQVLNYPQPTKVRELVAFLFYFFN